MSRTNRYLLQRQWAAYDKHKWDDQDKFTGLYHSPWRPIWYNFGCPPKDFRQEKNQIRRSRAKQAIREGKDPPVEKKDVWWEWL